MCCVTFVLFCFACWRVVAPAAGGSALVVRIDTAVGAAKVIFYEPIVVDN